MLCCLESEAQRIVTLQDCLSVVYTASDIAQVDTGEGVGGAGITAKADHRGVACCEDGYIGLISCQTNHGRCIVILTYSCASGIVGVAAWAAVPVIWDTFLSWVPDKIITITGEGEEALEDFGGEEAVWTGGGVVGH